MMSDGSAQLESKIQAGPWMPNRARKPLMSPMRGLKICSHNTDTATPEISEGM